jgi:hypothetical protein
MSIRLGIGIDNFASGGIDADAQIVYNRIIADGGVSNLERLNFFVKGLKGIYGSLSNVPVCYDAHWIGYKLGSGTGVTAGQAAAKLYSLTVAGDAVQTTAASQPLLLAHNGASSDNYWWGSGVSGGVGVQTNNCTTPNAAANQLTSSAEFIVCANLPSVSGFTAFINKDDVNLQRAYFYRINAGNVELFLNINGIYTQFISTTGHGLTANTTFWLKATRNGSNGNVEFYKSSDGIIYTQIGTTLTGISLALATNRSTPLEILSFTGNNQSFQGRIYRATISNSIGGTPVVDFNPAQYNASTSQTAWTSATGEIWTLNQDSTTATGYRGVLVDRTLVMSDGIDDNMTNTFSLDTVKTIYNSYTIWNELATNSLFASNNAAQIIDASMNGAIANVAQLDNAANSISVSIVGTAKLRTIRTAVINGASSLQRINNGTAATGTLGASISTSMKIMHERNGSYKSKMIYATLIVTSIADTTTQQTATFNLLKTLNRL